MLRQQIPSTMSKTLYILAEEPGKGGYSSNTICKFGTTVNSVSDRRSLHVRKSPEKVGRYVPLELCFRAVGVIANKETHIRRLTEEWKPDDHHNLSEWRKCDPRKLIGRVKKIASDMGWDYGVEFSRFGS
jgi:hypothetical protein